MILYSTKTQNQPTPTPSISLNIILLIFVLAMFYYIMRIIFAIRRAQGPSMGGQLRSRNGVPRDW
ncbi:hypothetical protein EJ04DRAFT_132386 [Polyplosphaeria fusca]|uniref:Uncharacterized protein n=1 Tax=Polyplosphaeria fusca TaxID=682080 RepID=A0A9P4QLK6_9PLEO|nr:hypothetical protein EJ04DRAFT_132386 [Polyplosphaeria fusca]